MTTSNFLAKVREVNSDSSVGFLVWPFTSGPWQFISFHLVVDSTKAPASPVVGTLYDMQITDADITFTLH